MDSAVPDIVDRVVELPAGSGWVEHDFALTRERYEAGRVGVGADELGGDANFAKYQLHDREPHDAAVVGQVVVARDVFPVLDPRQTAG